MANRSGPPGSPGNRGGNPSAGARSGAGARSASLGQRSRGARSNTAGNITGGGGAGGPKKKSPSVMRESTWNSMPKGQRMREYGTTSYKKYKEGKQRSNVRGTSRTNVQMRGRG